MVQQFALIPMHLEKMAPCRNSIRYTTRQVKLVRVVKPSSKRFSLVVVELTFVQNVKGGSDGKIIGITGGIASGKSTVTEFLRQKGFQVVDADAVVHQLQKPSGRLYQVLVEHFGEKILLEMVN